MLAKAGEGDRVIKTKMVRVPFFDFLHSIGFLILHPFSLYSSQNICSVANARVERHKEDDVCHGRICFVTFAEIFLQ